MVSSWGVDGDDDGGGGDDEDVLQNFVRKVGT